MNKPKVIVIAGPTASGKSNLAIELAKKIDGEIVSADSMQIYKDMDIGTAKVTPEEMQGIKHHMIDIIEPNNRYSVSSYKKQAESIDIQESADTSLFDEPVQESADNNFEEDIFAEPVEAEKPNFFDDVEEENISIYQKKKLKQSKRKSLTVIKENEKNVKNILENKENDSEKSKEKKGSNEIEPTKLFSSLGDIPNNREHTEPNLIDIGKLLISKESEDRINEKKKEIKKENKLNDNNVKELIDNKENKKNEKLSEKIKNINTIEDNSKDKTKENMSDNSSNDDYEDITFDFTFNEEQVPTT